jgi:hypothetical protein
MNKTIILTIIIGIMTIGIVNATTIDYKARCDITRPATEFRPEKTWYGIGIYGITVEKFGEIYHPTLTCFLPVSRHKETCTNKEITTQVCEDITTEVCSTEKVCEHYEWHHHQWECSEYKKFCNGEQIWHNGYWEGTGHGRHWHNGHFKCNIPLSYYECHNETTNSCVNTTITKKVCK